MDRLRNTNSRQKYYDAGNKMFECSELSRIYLSLDQSSYFRY